MATCDTCADEYHKAFAAQVDSLESAAKQGDSR